MGPYWGQTGNKKEGEVGRGVPETIDMLRKAGIKVWVLTGDKQVKRGGVVGRVCGRGVPRDPLTS